MVYRSLAVSRREGEFLFLCQLFFGRLNREATANNAYEGSASTRSLDRSERHLAILSKGQFHASAHVQAMVHGEQGWRSVVRALASHQCGWGSMPARDNCCPNFTSIHSRFRQMFRAIPKLTVLFFRWWKQETEISWSTIFTLPEDGDLTW